GGASLGPSPGVPMCSPAAQKRLAEFIRWVSRQQGQDLDVHLVVNGDIIDFLAEEPFEAFTTDEDAASAKFARILGRTEVVWHSLRDLVRNGAALTLLLGNHDLELSLPGPRRVLSEQLGPGRVEFLYDNQALALGPVLIEHGNRYDAWNLI